VLDPAAARLKTDGIEAGNQWKVGMAGETIAAFAQEGKYDMVIMGTHGHGSLARLVMGSVTTQVLAHCGVPVLLIR
jgi:nucleotide-binding universal stress UspA family protein